MLNLDQKFAVILPAAGLGRRFRGSGGGDKLEIDLLGKPVFVHALEKFVGRPEVVQVLLAINPDPEVGQAFRFKWADRLDLMNVQLVPGGKAERWETVMLALQHVDPAATHVAVHDAARPLTDPGLIDQLFAAAGDHPALVPGQPVRDSLKRVEASLPPAVNAVPAADPLADLFGDGEGSGVAVSVRSVDQSVERANLFAVQTPQVFERSLLHRAYDEAAAAGGLDRITDDAGLVERLGEPVHVLETDAINLKITRPSDADLAAAWLKHQDVRTAAARAEADLFLDDDED